MELSSTAQRFILHWGEMGARWGINRTVAQIHALLYLSPEPMHAEEISDTLAVARSTVSTGLHELQTWGIVQVVHVLGDRRDHFTTMGDVWAMFRKVLDERKQRELDPTLDMLRSAIDELDSSETDEPTREKLHQMLEFFESIVALYEQIQKLPLETTVQLARMGNLVGSLLTVAQK